MADHHRNISNTSQNDSSITQLKPDNDTSAKEIIINLDEAEEKFHSFSSQSPNHAKKVKKTVKAFHKNDDIDRPENPDSDSNKDAADRPENPDSDSNKDAADRPENPDSDSNKDSADRPENPDSDSNNDNVDRPENPDSDSNNDNVDRPENPNLESSDEPDSSESDHNDRPEYKYPSQDPELISIRYPRVYLPPKQKEKQLVIKNQPTYSHNQIVPDDVLISAAVSVITLCKYCDMVIKTVVVPEASLATFAIACALCLVCPLISFLPFWLEQEYNFNHYCPICGKRMPYMNNLD